MTDHPSADTDEALDLSAVEGLMQTLVKSLQATQLYLPNNPIYQKALESLNAAFLAVWEEWDELRLTVTDSEFLCEGQSVLSQPNRSESIPWVLYKDGVRRLALSPGAEQSEIVRLLSLIHRVRNLPPDAADDLLTLLWEEEFEHITYRAQELGLDDVRPVEVTEAPEKPSAEEIRDYVATETPEKPSAEEIRDHVATETDEKQATGIVKLEEFDSTLYFLDDSEIAYLRGEIDREYEQDIRSNVLTILFDLLELQTYTTVRSELISILENFIPYLLASGDFKSVAYILHELQVVIERGRELLPDHRSQLQELPGKLSQPGSLAQLLQALDEAPVPPTEEELNSLFRELKTEALEPILGWLPRITNDEVRELLRTAVRKLAQADPQQLADTLKTDHKSVVLEAVKLIQGLKLVPAVPAIGELLGRGDPEIQLAAVEALGELQSPLAMQFLSKALDTADRDVRVAAARIMATQSHRGAFDRIESVIGGKALRKADLAERTAFFEAYGLMAGDAGVGRLSGMLLGKGFMKMKEDPEIRACAAMALGKIATPAAKSVLEQASKEKDPLVKNAINAALRVIP